MLNNKSGVAFDGQSFEGARARLIAFTGYTLIALVTAFGGTLITIGNSYESLGFAVFFVALGYMLINAFIFIPMVHSDSYGIAFIGHVAVAFVTGLFVGPFMGAHKPVLLEAIVATGAVTVGMSAAGLLYPKFFTGIGRYLVVALWLFIFWMFGGILLSGLFGINFSGQLTSWIGIALFSLFIGHHVGKVASNDLTPTAVIAESCGAFLAIINLLLHMIGSRSDD